MKRFLMVLIATGALSVPAAGQTVPEGSQASRVQQAYRRTPSFRNDPFRHVAIPHWGLVFAVGAQALNSTLNLADLGALKYINDNDTLHGTDVVDMLGLVPRGTGISGLAQGEGAIYLGGPFGSHIGFGVSARGTGYGAFHLDDKVVALLRDGNSGQSDFSLGNSRGAGLATAEGGAHLIVRAGPVGSPDGVKVHLGVGGRYIRPIAYARQRSTLANGGVLTVTGDSITANIAIEQLLTREPERTARQPGTNLAADFLLRLEWPSSGLAIEALVANIGKVNVPLVERSTFNLNVATTSLQVIRDSLDKNVNDPNADFEFRPFILQDTATVAVTLPRIVRFTASSWANRILQIDLSATLPVTGEFESPLAMDIGTTWRFIRTLPLRAGVVLGGNQGIGFTGGLAIEGRTMYFQLAGQSLGGLFKNATGVGGRVELGLFF